ncbi:MAG TPA: heavy metal-associated domain-containing protein [Candidatus Mcinerneyibacteriales bacterium]|nr:heavy metal-associated domain-containing protein [Candidatus Mcinerneyibacteriales bacterium]HPE19879.1 heavy metal-associated domain-containing protein [Candidatus Mcinerneyibacteriales bacterium]HPJ69601.1 heavy metal-associated domain-containing protein [Candidatus Mcinerneyibacteriales bacterium]HPQ89733.1 heavy metal-associated domain-containing protein [Candidatus Mcinerneyibacteriales bacterium]
MKEIIIVEGMTCHHCGMAVRRAIEQLPGVKEIVVDLATGRIEVTGEEALDRERIRRSVEEEGYRVVS